MSESLWLAPKEFAESYHKIAIIDHRLGIFAHVEITNYIAGSDQPGFADNNPQYWRQLDKLVPLLAQEYVIKTPGALNATGGEVYFRPPTDAVKLQQKLKARPGLQAIWDKIDPNEEFYIQSLRRAYGGRASPHEIRDAIRLAIATGLTKLDAQSYAKKYFGLDCNTFVGNWLGISPSTGIFAYAHGYGKGKISGATNDVYTTRGRLPLPPVTSTLQFKTGNVLTTYTHTPNRKGWRWKHIALVHDIQPVSVAEDGTGKYLISIAEWGEKGDVGNHFKPMKEFTIKRGKVAREELPAVEFYYIETTVKVPDGDGTKSEVAARLFLDSSSLDTLPNRGFHVGGLYGT